jgi:hypothetical protein
MCVQEMHPRAARSTMYQAMKHNLGTVIGDTADLASILRHRGHPDEAAEIEAICDEFLVKARERYQALFEKALDGDPYHELEDHHRDGTERPREDVEAAALRYALRDATR